MIHTVHMPKSIHGGVTPVDDEQYMIFINADLPEEEQQRAFLHEMLHIWNRDLDSKGESVQEIESRTHRIIDSL